MDCLCDLAKCVCIGSVLGCVWSFSRGRQHYLTYLGSVAKGSLFGMAYSVHFLAPQLQQSVSWAMAEK